MATFKSRGMVIRSIKYGETSIITDIYTREKGMRSFIISGARKPKSKMSANFFQHGMILELIAYDKPSGQLARIKEVNTAFIYRMLPYDIAKSSLSLFVIEIIKNTLKEHEPNPGLYDFLEEWFIYLDRWDHNLSLLHLKFMLDFAAYAGFMPSQNYSEENPHFDLMLGRFVAEGRGNNQTLLDYDTSRNIYRIMSAEKEELHLISIHKKERLDIIEHLIVFYKLHIEGFKDLKSYRVLRQVL